MNRQRAGNLVLGTQAPSITHGVSGVIRRGPDHDVFDRHPHPGKGVLDLERHAKRAGVGPGSLLFGRRSSKDEPPIARGSDEGSIPPGVAIF